MKPLTDSIDTFYNHVSRSAALFVQMREGVLERDSLSTFLNHMHFIVSHTEENLALAAKLAAEAQKPSLEAFYLEKLGEEQGHEEWAEEDLKKGKSAVVHAHVMPLVRDFMLELRGFMHRNPYAYLGYILFAEYFTVRASENWLADLKNNPQLTDFTATIISNHAELDKQHIIDDLHALENIDGVAENLSPISELLGATMQFYEKFAESVCWYRH